MVRLIVSFALLALFSATSEARKPASALSHMQAEDGFGHVGIFAGSKVLSRRALHVPVLADIQLSLSNHFSVGVSGYSDIRGHGTWGIEGGIHYYSRSPFAGFALHVGGGTFESGFEDDGIIPKAQVLVGWRWTDRLAGASLGILGGTELFAKGENGIGYVIRVDIGFASSGGAIFW